MKGRLIVVMGLAAVLLSACTSTPQAPPPAPSQTDRSTVSSAILWQTLSTTPLLTEKLAIEAEFGYAKRDLVGW